MPSHYRKLIACLLGLAAIAVHAQPVTEGDAVLEEINFARAHPQDYVETLRHYRASYHGNYVDDPDEPGDHVTHEGVRALDEAIRFVAAQQPLLPLAKGDVLARAAVDLVAEQGPLGATGHVSAAGLNPGQRVVRRGGGPYIAETIGYGFSTPIAVVRQFIIDDGVADRGHRKVIFTPWLRYAGAGCGPHKIYRAMCVIDYGQMPDGRPAGPIGMRQ